MKEKNDARGTARCADCLFGRPVTVIDKDKSGKETAKAAKKAVKAAKFDPQKMFSDPEARDNYDVLCHNGAEIFAGKIGGRPRRTQMRRHRCRGDLRGR